MTSHTNVHYIYICPVTTVHVHILSHACMYDAGCYIVVCFEHQCYFRERKVKFHDKCRMLLFEVEAAAAFRRSISSPYHQNNYISPHRHIFTQKFKFSDSTYLIQLDIKYIEARGFTNANWQWSVPRIPLDARVKSPPPIYSKYIAFARCKGRKHLRGTKLVIRVHSKSLR